MKDRITLKDIARVAEVTIATVSMALRDNPRISKATRLKVRQIAEKLDYRPDPMLSWLTNYRKHRVSQRYEATLAWITATVNPEGHRQQPLFVSYFKGAQKRAESMGFHLDEFFLPEGRNAARNLSRVLWSRGIPGILIPPMVEGFSCIELDWEKFSTVAFGYTVKHPDLHRVTNSQFTSALAAVRNLHRLGYRRIGYCALDRQHDLVESNFLGGYLAGVAELPGLIPLPVYTSSLKAVMPAKNTFLDWVKSIQPDVIMTHSINPALEWLCETGYRVPQDMGFVDLSVSDGKKGVSGIDQRGEVTGAVAIDFLVGMVRRQERGIPEISVRILVDGVWKEGRTVRQQGQTVNG